jgi:hypothetical protein
MKNKNPVATAPTLALTAYKSAILHRNKKKRKPAEGYVM